MYLIASAAELRDPEFYKKPQIGPSHNVAIEDIMATFKAQLPTGPIREKFEKLITDLHEKQPQTRQDLEKALMLLRRKYKPFQFKKSQLLHVHAAMTAEGKLPVNKTLAKLLIKKSGKSESGVLVITVLTSPFPKFGKHPYFFIVHPH